MPASGRAMAGNTCEMSAREEVAVSTVGMEQDASKSSPPPSAKPEEDFTLIGPRKTSKKAIVLDEDEPLIDTTEAIPLKSKKTERMQKRQEKKLKRTKVQSETKSFLELPSELLQEVLSHLQPSDVFRLLRLNKSTRDFVLDNESSIARSIVRRRYWSLARCFYTPVLLSAVDPSAQSSLSSKRWQDCLKVHKYPYQQHIRPHDPAKLCSCMSCVMAWNNLNLILDLAHFQRHLSLREPIPMIPRGTFPEWNTLLLDRNAAIALKATTSPLIHAAILQTHLQTIISTLTRAVHVGKKSFQPKKHLFRLSAPDIAAETDEFLERSGPPSYQIPVHRDNYYSLEAYVPNRKWSKERQRWMYPEPGKGHESDVAWVAGNAYFKPDGGGSSPADMSGRTTTGKPYVPTDAMRRLMTSREVQS